MRKSVTEKVHPVLGKEVYRHMQSVIIHDKFLSRTENRKEQISWNGIGVY